MMKNMMMMINTHLNGSTYNDVQISVHQFHLLVYEIAKCREKIVTFFKENIMRPTRKLVDFTVSKSKRSYNLESTVQQR